MTENAEAPTGAPGEERKEAPLELRVFGAMELSGRAGLEALLAQPKRAALLAYLAVARPRGFHRRDKIVGLFWPEHDQEHARAALRKAIYEIRKPLGEGVIVSRGDEEIAVDRAVLRCDADEFDTAIKNDRLMRALELYDRGALLEGFFADAPGFEKWLEVERQRYEDAASDTAWELAERYMKDNNLTRASRYARIAVKFAPTEERKLRRALNLLDGVGDKAGAVRVYEDFARKLKDQYGVEPSAETRDLIRRIRGG